MKLSPEEFAEIEGRSNHVYLGIGGDPLFQAVSDVRALLAHFRETQPRAVTTVEELDALPDKTVIQYAGGSVMQRRGSEWFYTSDAAAPDKSEDVELPTTVIYTP